MSDEADRAAKAARAKAMLKKRQQKKAPGSGVSSARPSSPALASPPGSRPFTPGISEAPAVDKEEKTDLGDVFASGNGVNEDWVSSLPRVDAGQISRTSSPASASFPSGPIQSPPPGKPALAAPTPLRPSEDPLVRFTTELEKATQTISSLQTERTNLLDSLERLRGIESKCQEQEALLQAERNKSEHLRSVLEREQDKAASLSSEAQSLQDLLSRQEDLESELRARGAALLEEEQHKSASLERELQNQHQTISLLVSEKSSLTASLERLEDLESEARSKELALQQERAKSQALAEQSQQLQREVELNSERIHSLETQERILTDKFRDQERELQLTLSDLTQLRDESEQHRRRVRELEEQIQNDDRVEVLEQSLKNTQERADEFEFQLSKLKQAHVALKAEHDDAESRIRSHAAGEAEWQRNHDSLNEQHKAILEQLAAVTSARDTLSKEKASLQSQIDASQAAQATLQAQLTEAASGLAAQHRQLQAVQTDLRNATRRADEAEAIQKDLQTEGTNLMRSLDEMRPKIVELTDTKLELVEKVASLEQALRNRDTVISQLEGSSDEIQHLKAESDIRLREAIDAHEKERASVERNLLELQRAYSELQGELEATRSSVQAFNAERATHHQLAASQLNDIERLTALSRSQAEELDSALEELEARKQQDEAEQSFIQQTQAEMESLRSEIERLREAPPSPALNGRSLDDEMLSSLRQQHALDLSSAHSQIRSLETSVFEAEARAHSLQKRVRALEDELAQSHSSPRIIPRAFSPSIPRRASDELRRSSFSHKPSGLAPPPARSAFDLSLSPETRHKRKVSLSMLKARIDSEMAAAAGSGSRPGSRAMSPALGAPAKSDPAGLETVHEPRPGSSLRAQVFKRPQFLDESHVFLCHSCEGDLVIL
ncbi:hypothetical protein PLICRDRAFT_36258 [Plicaturopsis crispa FD-325 SS-3]|nr:hypothetical protein PLICRDRAFT_36258 [Plicaturopsis crispa FD-325 SS-3]